MVCDGGPDSGFSRGSISWARCCRIDARGKALAGFEIVCVPERQVLVAASILSGSMSLAEVRAQV